jgi:cytochrome c553
MPLPESWGPEVKSVAAVSDADPIAYGKYVTHNLAFCMECHSKPGEGGLTDMVNGLGAGGAQIRGAAGLAIAPNITPSGIGHYSDDDLKKVIKTGVRPDGSKLNVAMPWQYYSNMSDKDLSAVVAYLKTLPKK